jgi:hypothetical protein
MAGKALSLACVCLSLVLCRTTGAAAHSLKEVQQAFEQESISPELVEVTKELEITAGMKSVREQVPCQATSHSRAVCPCPYRTQVYRVSRDHLPS